MDVLIFLHQTEVSLDTRSTVILPLHLAWSGVEGSVVLLLLVRQQGDLGQVVDQGRGVVVPPVWKPGPQPPVVVVAAPLHVHLVPVQI